MSTSGDSGAPGGALGVGRFFGVPLYFAPSWLVIAAVITASYAGLVRDTVPQVSQIASYAIAAGYAVLLAMCVLVHELGHTAVSLRLGHPVRRVVIFLLGGISELEGDILRARDEFLIAVAGPLVSGAVAIATGVLAWLATPHTVVWLLLVLLSASNVVIAAFNLLPGLPLDGGRLLRAGVWRIAGSRLVGTRVACRAGQLIAVAVGGGSVALDAAGYGFTTGLLGVLMAVFIWMGATQSLRGAELSERIPLLSVASFLRPGVLVTAEVSVAEALRRTWQAQARGLVVVDAADRPQAIVDEVKIRSVAPQQRAWTSVTEVSRALEPGLVLPLNLAGPDLMTALRRTPAHEYLIVHPDGSPAGILASADLAKALT